MAALQVNSRKHDVVYEGREADLSSDQWRLFEMLWKTDEPIGAEELADRLYGDDMPVDVQGAIRSVLLRLGRKLDDIGARDKLINRRGQGYMILRD